MRVVGVVIQLAIVACGSRAQHTPRSDADRAAAAPTFAFLPPQAWRSPTNGALTVAPPDLARETWRVLVSQDRPIQLKTPQWQPLLARATVELQMPSGSAFRCVAPPLEVKSEANAPGTKLKAWRLTRSVRCSSDGWRSWTESIHRVKSLPDGSREVGPDAGLLLRDRDRNGNVRETFALLRSDQEHREATTGPPQILSNAVADQD
jgi:hypothetical protein